MASSNSPTRLLHRFEEHGAAVKALAWCPYQANLLASCGGHGDQCIKTWNTHTGARLKSVDTGSEVFSIAFQKVQEEEVLLQSPAMERRKEWFFHLNNIQSLLMILCTLLICQRK